MSHLIRSISGIRGITGVSLTPSELVCYAGAYTERTGQGLIVIGYDGRPSGLGIKSCVSGILAMNGMDVLDIGMVPTPTVQLAVTESGARGGISITASHNPAEWNGLKFLDEHGIFLDGVENTELFSIADSLKARYVRWEEAGSITADHSAAERHIEAVLSFDAMPVDRIRERKFRVVVDAVNASGSEIVPDFLSRLGCDVIKLYCDGSGIFPHTPEPLAENLGALGNAVREHQADVGIAVDPDADRLVLFDEKGLPFGEEYTITSAIDGLLGVLDRRDLPPVVVNLSTTRAVDDICARYGTSCLRTPVGEINVVQKMLETDSVIGGEGSGGVIMPAIHAGRDSLVGMYLVLGALTRAGVAVSEYKSSLPAYTIHKTRYPLTDLEPAKVFSDVKNIFREERLNSEDGVRIDFDEGWVHLRASNTEPILRVISEARTRKGAEELARRVVGSVLAISAGD